MFFGQKLIADFDVDANYMIVQDYHSEKISPSTFQDLYDKKLITAQRKILL